MFDQADSRSAKARATYKRYADRVVRHKPIYKVGVYLLRPPTEAKRAREKDMNIADVKLRQKMTGPYKVLQATPETVKMEEDGLPITVSIY